MKKIKVSMKKGVPQWPKDESVYLRYLRAAGQRGQFTEEDVAFWSRVNIKTKENTFFSPFTYIYKQKYRSGIRARAFSFGKNFSA